MGDATVTGSDEEEALEARRVVCLVEDPAAAEAVADAEDVELDVSRVDEESSVRARLSTGSVGCLVADPAVLDSDPGRFRSAVLSDDADPPVVWVTDDPASLGEDALGGATTIVERPDDPRDWSFLGEKVRAAIEDGPGAGHGPGRYRKLVESARDGLYILDANAEVTYLNESFAEMLGYEREELLGTHAARSMAAGELERGQGIVRELIESDSRESEVVDMEMETKSGGTVTASVNFVVLTDDDGTYEGLMGVVRDVTDRKERERELERYETIVETTTEPIFVLDDGERFVRVNDAMTAELGYPRGTLLGSHVSRVTGEADVGKLERLIGELVDGERDRATTEVDMTAADGTRRRYAISMAVIREDGEFEGTVVTAHDVTDLREHQRKLSVLDRVLRHNVRNKMTVILGHASDIEADAAPPNDRRAGAIQEAATELLELSDSAREFESVFADDAPGKTAVDVVDAVEDVVRELGIEHPAAEISAALPESAIARGHETFELALNELVENAIVHNDSETPTVEVTVTRDPDAVRIRVADDGPGLNETDRKALMRGDESPLEHTQGLGLWLVRWSVEIANGRIDIVANDPRGTVITVTLPRADT